MSYFVQYTINGLTAGAFYALVALGYTIVYGIIRLINFAHGDLTMVGAFIGWTALIQFGLHRLPLALAIALAAALSMLVTSVINVGILRFAYRPLLRKSLLAILITALEQQVRHPEQRFAEERSGDPARDLIVPGRRRRLARDLPERAARKSVCGRFPEIEARGARETVVHRPLIRMPELVDRERIVVDDPAVMQIASDRREVRVVILAGGVPVGQIQQDVETEDLERRKKVTLARLDIRRKIGLGLPGDGLPRIILELRP